MKFIRYIWDLYRNSIEGQKDISIFQNIDIASLSERFGFSIEMKYHDANQDLQSFKPYHEATEALKREKARIVLEAKYSINSEKDLQEAFDQARSYGLRLQSEKIVLADRDFVWVYGKANGDFHSDPVLKLHWNELTGSDKLYELRNALNLK
ncbi:MAG: hypothetical protein K9I94_05950 [Bacteroidales bacterium]|nr:hypothetical protein [Bacteroidales bacterium]